MVLCQRWGLKFPRVRFPARLRYNPGELPPNRVRARTMRAHVCASACGPGKGGEAHGNSFWRSGRQTGGNRSAAHRARAPLPHPRPGGHFLVELQGSPGFMKQAWTSGTGLQICPELSGSPWPSALLGVCGRRSGLHGISCSHPTPFPAPLTPGLPALPPTSALGCEAAPPRARMRAHKGFWHSRGSGFSSWCQVPDSASRTAAGAWAPRCRFTETGEFLGPSSDPAPGPAKLRHLAGSSCGQLQPAHTLQKLLCQPISCPYRPTPPHRWQELFATSRLQGPVAATCLFSKA